MVALVFAGAAFADSLRRWMLASGGEGYTRSIQICGLNGEATLTTLLLELPDALAGELQALAIREGEAVERYVVSALFDHAQRYAVSEEGAEPALIAEGSLEEDAALEAALSGSFHAFDVEAAHNKMLLLRR